MADLTDDQITTVSNDPPAPPAPAPEVDPSTGEPIIAADPTTGGDSDGDPSSKQDPWYKRRIDELSRDKHEARRHAERLERELSQQRELLERLVPQEPAPQGPQTPDPSRYAGGEYDPRYLQDMLAYTKETAIAEARQAVANEYRQREEAQRHNQHQTALADAEKSARASLPDYDNVVGNLLQDRALIENPVIQQAILGSTQGPQIAYELGRNPEIAYEIARMSPIEAGMRIASLISPPPQGPKGGAAPTPTRPLGAGANTPSGGGKKTYAEMTTAEYIAARNAEEVAARKARAGR